MKFGLKKLRLKDFGPFKDEIVIDFPSNGTVLIQGENGSGKSCIIQSIAYCLDFLGDSATDLVNWETGNDIFAELTLYDGVDNDIVIQRGTGFYQIERHGLTLKGTEAAKKIKSIMLDSLFIKTMTYREQGETGNFINLKPSEKQDFLSALLNLDDFEKVIEKSEKEIQTFELKTQLIDNEYKSIFNSASNLVSNIESDQAYSDKLKTDLIVVESQVINEPDVTDLDAKIKQAESVEWTDVPRNTDELSDKLSKLNSYERELRKDKDNSFNQIAILNRQMSAAEAIINTKEHINKKIAILKQNLCSTCGQAWDNAKDEVAALEGSLQTVSLKEIEKRALHDAMVAYKESLVTSEAQILSVASEIKAVSDQLNKINIEKAKIVQRNQDLVRTVRSLKKERELISENFILQKKNIEDKKKQITDAIANFDIKMQNSYSKLEQLNIDLEEKTCTKLKFETLISQEKEILTVAKDFLRLITEDTLKLINAAVTKTIQNFPNVSGFSVKFDTSKQNKNGKQKKEIVLKVYKYGTEVPFHRLSGGQKCSINLATDLAISSVLSIRTGKEFGWSIFDESLDGMSVINKTEALSALKAISINKVIILSEHSSEIATSDFDRVISVKQTKNGSAISL